MKDPLITWKHNHNMHSSQISKRKTRKKKTKNHDSCSLEIISVNSDEHAHFSIFLKKNLSFLGFIISTIISKNLQ